MRLLGIVLMLFSIGTLVAGKVSTFHDTEGEALVNGWRYWVASVAFGVMGLWLFQKTEEKG